MDKNILDILLKAKTEDILKALYEYRENEGKILTLEFKEELKETQLTRKNIYNKFKEKLKNNINDKEKISEMIELLEQYENVYNNEHGLYYEQYYKTGIKDVIKLILQCLS